MEDAVNVGDQFQIGSAKLVATQPRMPCYKLGVKFGIMEVVRRFLVSGKPGIYFKVLKEGQVQVGDKIEIISKDKNNVTVKDIVHLYITRDHACIIIIIIQVCSTLLSTNAQLDVSARCSSKKYVNLHHYTQLRSYYMYADTSSKLTVKSLVRLI